MWQKQLAILEQIEVSGAGFWTRNGDKISIFVRGAHGNDPNQWTNAHAIGEAFGTACRSIEPDGMSGHVVVTVKAALNKGVK